MRKALICTVATSLAALIGCNAPQVSSKNYGSFRSANPQSILVVPVVNRTVDVTAADFFLATITRPVAERGYYVFPVNLVKHTLEDDGLADANLVHKADPRRLGTLFGADAVLYVTIEEWTAKYAVLSTSVDVRFTYSLKSCKTGQELWASKEAMHYAPNNNSSGGNPLAQLIGAAVSAAVTKAAPNYIPLAQEANGNAVVRLHHGLPAGPHHPNYGKDQNAF